MMYIFFPRLFMSNENGTGGLVILSGGMDDVLAFLKVTVVTS
jgi:hypothetical protein